MADLNAPNQEHLEAALGAMNKARIEVMALYGGNLDHPALDHIETAMGLVVSVDRNRT